MLKTSLIITTLLMLSTACQDHHGHEAHPNWAMEITIGEAGATKTLPVLMDDFVSAIDYSPVNFHAEAHSMAKMNREFAQK